VISTSAKGLADMRSVTCTLLPGFEKVVCPLSPSFPLTHMPRSALPPSQFKIFVKAKTFQKRRPQPVILSIRYKEEILHDEGGEAPAEIAQRSCGCPLPGSAQGQVGPESEQPDLVEDVPALGRGVRTRWSIRSLPTPTTP